MPDVAFDSAQEAAPDSLIAQTLGGKYLIEERIAIGGMCAVYRATQLAIGKTVAVKVLLPQLAVDTQIVRRFEQEARTASRIYHPHVINVFDFGQAPHGSSFIVMDFIAGKPLNALLRREGPLPIPRVADLLNQICGALQAAHAQGVVHRDLKPGNILISQTDGQDWVTVVDFGIAKIQEDLGQSSNLTGTNAIIGTPRYMSPEQADGGTVDARSDIYSLGIVLYEMLAGEAPFQHDSATQLLLKQATEAPPPLREKRPDVPGEVEEAVLWALAKDPAQRPAAVAELNTAFQQAVLERGDDDDDDKTLLARRVRRPSQIVIPLSATDTAHAQQSPDLKEGTTVVRPARRGQTATTLAAVTKRVANWARQRPAAALLLCAAVLLGLFGVALLTTSADADAVSLSITDAQREVTLAQTRINKLPAAHALSGRLAQLNQWESELSGFTVAQERAGKMQSRAETIARAAGQYAEQARVALEQLDARQGVPPPAERQESGRGEVRARDRDRGGDDKGREDRKGEDKEWEKEREREKRNDEKRRERGKKQEEEMKKMREQAEKLFKRN